MAWFSLCSTTVFLTRPRTLGRPSSSDSVFLQSHGKGLIRVSGCSHFYVFSLTLSRRFGLELQCCHMGASISFTLHEGEIIFWKTCLHFAAKRIFSYFFLILSVTIRHHDGWQDKAWLKLQPFGFSDIPWNVDSFMSNRPLTQLIVLDKSIHPFSSPTFSLSGSQGCQFLTWLLLGEGAVHPGQGSSWSLDHPLAHSYTLTGKNWSNQSTYEACFWSLGGSRSALLITFCVRAKFYDTKSFVLE